jgi:TolB-like protein
MTAPDVFLSYNREDSGAAKRFADGFAAEGLKVWWDTALRSGEAYDEVTEAALRGAKAVVVLWSPRSVVSRWVRAEATIADRCKTLVPVTIEACERPIMFELTQTAELSHWAGEPQDTAWLAFLGDVKRMVGRETGAALATAQVSASATAGSGMPSVALVPFIYRGSDKELEFLAEDLTEEITRELAQSSYFKVIAAGAMASWRGKAIDHRALGREIDASYLIEGKLRHVGEDLRLTLELIDANTAGTVWSTRLFRKLAAHNASPEDFPVAVACELGEYVVQIEMARAMKKQGPLSGWEHLLRAMTFAERLRSDSLRSAVEELRKAVLVAPDFGLAHAMLARLLGVITLRGLEVLDAPRRREIRKHVNRAMELDGDNSATLAHVASACGTLGDGESFLRLARRAIELAPHSLQAYFAFGMANFRLGRIADALAAFKYQLRLAQNDFNRPVALEHLGICLCLEGKPAEAEAALDQSLAFNPDFGAALVWKGIVAAQMGNEQTARFAVMRLRDVESELSFDQHVHILVDNPQLAERSAGAVDTFRRLWDET